MAVTALLQRLGRVRTWVQLRSDSLGLPITITRWLWQLRGSGPDLTSEEV